ncbi:MAG: DUF697 domain-containing protein [Desulfobacterium sp.]
MVKEKESKMAEEPGVDEKAKADGKVDVDVEVDKKVLADSIIRKRVYTSVGTGFIPIPIFDILALTGVQIEMVSKLSNLYGIPFKKDVVKTAISALVGGILPVAAAPLLSSMLKFIPVIGQTTSAIALSATGGASTYALGQVFKQHFESGGTLLNFNAEKAQAYYYEQFNKGEKVAASAQAK